MRTNPELDSFFQRLARERAYRLNLSCEMARRRSARCLAEGPPTMTIRTGFGERQIANVRIPSSTLPLGERAMTYDS